MSSFFRLQKILQLTLWGATQHIHSMQQCQLTLKNPVCSWEPSIKSLQMTFLKQYFSSNSFKFSFQIHDYWNGITCASSLFLSFFGFLIINCNLKFKTLSGIMHLLGCEFLSHQYHIGKTILHQSHTTDVELHHLLLIKNKEKQAKKTHVAKAFKKPDRSGFWTVSSERERKQNIPFPSCSLEDQHLIKSAPVCSWYPNFYSCLAQHSVCQTSNQGIHDDCNVEITMTSSVSKFLLCGVSKETTQRLLVLSLTLSEQNEPFAMVVN